ncbi:MAG: hypothetical protein ABR954_06995 [Dehalococcoidales bacterium]
MPEKILNKATTPPPPPPPKVDPRLVTFAEKAARKNGDKKS